MNTNLKAEIMLLMVTLSWGFSYILNDICLAELDAFTLNAIRFLIAFAVSGVFSFRRLKNISKRTLLDSLILGAVLSVVYACATIALQYTTLSNAGFLCGLAVVFTPLLSALIFKTNPEKKLVFVVAMCLIGIALLTLTEEFSINAANFKGDILCIICSAAYAVVLLLTERFVARPDADPIQIGVLQIGITGIISLVFAIIFETPRFPTQLDVWSSILILAVFCTGVAFIIQNIAQQHTSASRVGVIFSLEPVFAGIVAYLFAGEILSARSYAGVALILAGLFIMEINIKPKVV